MEKKKINAGGNEMISEGSVAGFFESFNDRVKEHRARGKANLSGNMVMVKGGIDRQRRVPEWINRTEDIAIDGSPLTPEEHKGSFFARYAHELAIGEEVQKGKQIARGESNHSVIGGVRAAGRWFGIGESPVLTEAAARQVVQTRSQWTTEVDTMDSIQQQGGYDRNKMITWERLMSALEHNRPLAKISKEYRPRVDVYGIDPFLDHGFSLSLGCVKYGAMMGAMVGGVRGTRMLINEMHVVVASGLSFIVLVNVMVFSSALKYAAHGLMFSCMFVAGDRATTSIKRRFLPAHEAEQRSTANYVIGFGASLTPVGLSPWWFFNDLRMAARYAISGAVVGGITGFGVGIVVERLAALNLQRIKATDRELRRYEALMKRQKLWCEREMERRSAMDAAPPAAAAAAS